MKNIKNKVNALIVFTSISLAACNSSDTPKTNFDPQTTFRYDTFGDEAHWTDILRWNEVVTTISPVAALGVGLKVDSEAVPKETLDAVLASEALLNDPTTTLTLLKLDAVVGIKATVEEDGTVSKFGITCALCHSTVDDSIAKGIGKRLDGWPAKDLDPGLIISLSPFFDDKPSKRAELQSWGKGMYDPFWNQDGINDPVQIPPAYGLKNVPLATYTGEGDISFWNAYVAITQMGGQGSFKSEELGLDITADPDLVTEKLPALKEYQFSLNAPEAPEGSFNVVSADRGKDLFNGKANCSTCHSGDDFTDVKLHYPVETGSNPDYATLRGSNIGQYRTTPLKGIWSRAPYFHDGAHATLVDVVDHYDSAEVLNTNLSTSEKSDLVEYLQSL